MWQSYIDSLPLTALEKYQKLRAILKETSLSQDEEETWERKALNLGHILDVPEIHKLIRHFYQDGQYVETSIFLDAKKIGFLGQQDRNLADQQLRFSF
ncbi:MAG: hypothetical protein NTW73_02980 [Candidatus Parcubacteria bacterium]|nr:hypothetical protein [Candidatus Parcubacteria bacterium]